MVTKALSLMYSPGSYFLSLLGEAGIKLEKNIGKCIS